MNRRKVLGLGIASVTLVAIAANRRMIPMAHADDAQFPLSLEKSPTSLEALDVSNDQWRQHLTKEQYRVLRKHGTERAFTSELNDESRDGEYLCAGCGLLLFTSNTKFDSGTGWPSFFDGVTDHIGTSTDYKLIYPRTEYHCKRCGGHQGHVFKDGPEPTGLRYCNNGVALQFAAT